MSADTHTVPLSRRRPLPLEGTSCTAWHTPAGHSTPHTQHCTLIPTHNYTSRAPQNCDTPRRQTQDPKDPNTAEGGGDSEAASRQTCQPDRHTQGDTMTTAPPRHPHSTPTAHSAFHTPMASCTPLSKCAQTLGGNGMCLLTPQPHHPGSPRSYTHSWATSSIHFPFLRDPRPWH